MAMILHMLAPSVTMTWERKDLSEGQSPASLQLTLLCPQIFQAYLAFQELRNDAPVPYKRSLDEGGVVLTSLSPPSAASPVNTPTTGPHGPSYASSSLSPYLSTPKAPRLAMMPDN